MAIAESRVRTAATTRSIAGNVAPMAAVAGSSSRNVPPNTTAHCHTGDGLRADQVQQRSP